MLSWRRRRAIAGATISSVCPLAPAPLAPTACLMLLSAEKFRDFYARYADMFLDAPLTLSGEQNMEYYALYQRYLKLYEDTLQGYIESLDVSIPEFYRELAEVKNDPEIKDKKLLYFVDYLVACTDYESFYKVMIRAAKKLRAAESKDSQGGAADSKEAKGGSSSGGFSDSKGHK